MPTDPMTEWVAARTRAIGNQIRQAREHTDLTQSLLGEVTGLDAKTIDRIEKGVSETDLGRLILIADAIGVPLSHLLREEPRTA